MGDSEFIKCVVCADDATPRVIKDSGYNAMMGLFWEAMDVDVKYTENIKFDLCPPCFNQILQFYDLNDACVIMEKRIHLLTKKIVNKAIKGVEKLKKESKPTLEVQDKIIEKYGTTPIEETVDENGIKFEYEFECRTEDTATESKAPVKNKPGETRKTVFSFSSPLLGKATEETGEESSDSDIPKPKTSKGKKGVKTAKGRGRQKPKPKVILPKRGRRKSSSTEKEEEEKVYSESDDSTDEYTAKIKQPAKKAKEGAKEKPNEDSEDQELPEDEKDKEEEQSEKSVGSQNSGRSRLQCEICFSDVLNAKMYDMHIKRHTVKPGAGFQCRVCRKAYEKKEDLLRHKKLHDDDKYPCPVCKVTCEVASKIIQHVMLEHKDFWNRQPQTLCPAGFD